MRCKNCGWQNPETATVCEKCHSKLKTTYNPNRPSATRPGDARDLGRTPTVMGGVNPFASAMDPASTLHPSASGNPFYRTPSPIPSPQDSSDEERMPSICPDCGYPLSGCSDSCPNCGKKFNGQPSQQYDSSLPGATSAASPLKGTILSSNPFPGYEELPDGTFPQGDYSLQPVDEDGRPYDEPLLINEGDTIVIGNERFLFTKIR